jgi:hypothetical protein
MNMTKFGFAAVATAGLAAALLGLAGPAQASTTALPTATTIATGVDHLDWLNDIQPKVNVPQVDTSVRHSGGR